MSQYEDAMPVRFEHLPSEKFPVRMLFFSPAHDLVFDSGEIHPNQPTEIPGLSPESVRYHVLLFGDGTVSFEDDPTCNGTIQALNAEELGGMVARLLELVQTTGRTQVGDSCDVLEWLRKNSDGKLNYLELYFEKQAELGELMLSAVDHTRKLLEAAKAD